MVEIKMHQYLALAALETVMRSEARDLARLMWKNHRISVSGSMAWDIELVREGRDELPVEGSAHAVLWWRRYNPRVIGEEEKKKMEEKKKKMEAKKRKRNEVDEYEDGEEEERARQRQRS